MQKEKIPDATVGQVLAVAGVGIFIGGMSIYVSHVSEEHWSNEIVFWIGIALIAYSVLVGGGVFIWGMVASSAERRMMSAEARSSSRSRGPRDSAADKELRARFRRESDASTVDSADTGDDASNADDASDASTTSVPGTVVAGVVGATITGLVLHRMFRSGR